MRMFLMGALVVTGLSLSGCIPYVAGVIATSRANASGKQQCAETNGEWVDGSSWGWNAGRCVQPLPKGQERTPQATCLELGGIWYAEQEICRPGNAQ